MKTDISLWQQCCCKIFYMNTSDNTYDCYHPWLFPGFAWNLNWHTSLLFFLLENDRCLLNCLTNPLLSIWILILCLKNKIIWIFFLILLDFIYNSFNFETVKLFENEIVPIKSMCKQNLKSKDLYLYRSITAVQWKQNLKIRNQDVFLNFFHRISFNEWDFSLDWNSFLIISYWFLNNRWRTIYTLKIIAFFLICRLISLFLPFKLLWK